MRVPSDFQIPVTAPRSGVLEALGLKVGETLSARVVAQNSNGSTLVQIGNQQVSLNLSQQFPTGTQLQFEVKVGGAKPELTLLPAGAKPTNTAAPQTGQPQTSQPQVIVSSSILNQSGAVTPQSGTVTQTTANTPTSAPAPQNAVQNPTTQPQTPPASNTGYPRPPLTAPPSTPTAQPIPGAPTSGSTAPANAQSQTIALPLQISASLNLTAGQAVAARVATPTPQGQAQITIGGQTIPVANTNLPAPGTALQGQVITQNGQVAITVQATQTGNTPYQTLPSGVGNSTANAGTSGTVSSPTAPTSTIATATAAPPVTSAQMQAPPNLAQVAAQAVVGQDSLSKLITTITGLSATTTKDLPANISQLTRQISEAPLKLDTILPNAQNMKDAVARSGVFLESVLARGAPPPMGPQGDMKNMLMLFRNALGNWLDGDPLPQNQGQKPAPPMRGAPPRAEGQVPQNPLPDGASAREAGRHLLAQTESALSRMRLFQLSSLPEAAQRGNPVATQELQFELPLMLNGQAAMAQFQVNRDGGNESDAAQRGWQMVFAVNFGAIGAVGAKISFRAHKTGVLVWAENEATAEVLEEMLPELVDGLTAQGLELSSVRVRHHAPDAPPTNTGGFVDSIS